MSALPGEGPPRSELPKREAEQNQDAIAGTHPAPVPSSAFQRPHLGLLSAVGTVNGERAKILFDDCAMIKYASTKMIERLKINTTASTESPRMPDGMLHPLTSTATPVNLKVGRYQVKLHLAVCPLTEYAIILGKKWHEDFDVRKNYRKNKVMFRKGGKPISIRATLDTSNTLISKQKLARILKRGQPAFAIFLRPSESSAALEINFTDVQHSLRTQE